LMINERMGGSSVKDYKECVVRHGSISKIITIH